MFLCKLFISSNEELNLNFHTMWMQKYATGETLELKSGFLQLDIKTGMRLA